MITIVAGSRTITDYALVKSTIEESGFAVTLLVSGMAPARKKENYKPSVDLLGVRWAIENKIPYRPMPADWDRYGNAAGMVRNGAMGDFAVTCPDGGALIGLQENGSSGTENMIEQALQRGLNVFAKQVERTETGWACSRRRATKVAE